MLFTQKYIRYQIFNLSTSSETIPGYSVICDNKSKDVYNTLSYYITSVRLQINRDSSYNMIKIVHNDHNDMPQSIIFIGKKFTDESISKILDTFKTSLILAVDKLKVYELSYICLINNLKEIKN